MPMMMTPMQEAAAAMALLKQKRYLDLAKGAQTVGFMAPEDRAAVEAAEGNLLSSRFDTKGRSVDPGLAIAIKRAMDGAFIAGRCCCEASETAVEFRRRRQCAAGGRAPRKTARVKKTHSLPKVVK